MAELANVRSVGYAVDDEGSEEGVCCVSVPVLAGPSNDLVAAISVSGPSFRIPAYKIPRLAKTVLASAARLSEARLVPRLLGLKILPKPNVARA